ncbi:MAG: DUF7255 family protein [Thermoleophilaceae bacterium]
MDAGLDEEVASVYRALGGVGDQPRVAPGPWDVQVDGVAIELDEENHFNRYRGLTLDSPLYETHAAVDVNAYRAWCGSHESACLTYGGYWKSDASECEFGAAGPEGDLSGSGSPRWKQRAFYDFIKDLAPAAVEITVSRLSIYEEVQCGDELRQLGHLLADGDDRLMAAGWAEAILTRVHRPTSDHSGEDLGAS